MMDGWMDGQVLLCFAKQYDTILISPRNSNFQKYA